MFPNLTALSTPYLQNQCTIFNILLPFFANGTFFLILCSRTTISSGPIEHPVEDFITKQQTGTVKLDREVFGAPLR